MPCYHPLLRVWVDSLGDWRVRSYPKDLRPGFHEAVCYCGRQIGYRGCSKDFPGAVPYQTIPCGKCLGCRMQYSRQWANRCMLELEYHDSAYFVTVTYNDYHVRTSYYADPDTGEATPSLTLSKRDHQLFLKRLRERFPDDHIRFFMCGEYGPSTWRPHMHYIIFGLHLTDLRLDRCQRGHNVYKSPALERVWSERIVSRDLLGNEISSSYDPIGFVEVMDVSWAACSYVARYIMKKQLGPDGRDFYRTFGLEPPFVLMSRNPGLGRQWYDDHPDIDEFAYINLKTEKGGLKFTPPRYYVDLFERDHHEESEVFKANRLRMAENSVRAKLERTDLSYLEYLAVEEDKLQRRTASLKREEI